MQASRSYAARGHFWALAFSRAATQRVPCSLLRADRALLPRIQTLSKFNATLQRTRRRSAEGDPLPKLAARSAEQRVTLCPIKLILSASRGVQRLVVWHPRPSDAAFSGLGDRGRPPSDRRLRSTAACMRSPAATREPPPSVAYNALDHGPIEADQLRSGAEDSGRLSIRVVEYQPRHPVP